MPSPTSPDAQYDAKFKLVLVGESTVGKSSIAKFLSGEDFSGSLISTIGIDFIKRVFQVGDSKVMLEIWDTAGQERFHSLTSFHYRGTKAIVLVYDVTNAETFRRIRSYWLRSAEVNLDDPVPMFLLGNKIDLVTLRSVSTESGESLKEQQCFHGFYETSAKTGLNIVEAFQDIANILGGIHGISYSPEYVQKMSESRTTESEDFLRTPKTKKKSKKYRKSLTIKLRSSSSDSKQIIVCCAKT